MLNIGDEWGGRCVNTKSLNVEFQIFNIWYSTFNIWHPIFFQILETVRGGNLVDLITVNEMCYKSANVANVADLANVLQIGIGRILFLLESTKLSQPDKIINATVHVIVIEILIVIVIVIVINFYDAMYHEIEIIFIWSKFLNVL